MTRYNEEELKSIIQPMKRDLLDRLIEDRLILQEAKREGIQVDENRVKARIEEIKKEYRTDTEFQRALAGQGLAQADIESKVREQLLMYGIVETKIKSKIVVKPAQVTEFYEKNRDEFKIPEQCDFSFIKVGDEDLAKQICNNLKEGLDFTEVAQKHSLTTDNLLAYKGGELKKDIEEVLFNLKPGEISAPVKIEGSFYIFKLNNIIAPLQKNLSEVQDKIYALLLENKMQEAMAGWLDELRKKSYIKICAD
jgi:parvulin-like peptidyl-prolyl isomerase